MNAIAGEQSDHAPKAAPARPPLFRPEVADRYWEQLEAKGLRQAPPRRIWLLLSALTLLVAGTAAFLTLHPLIREESAPGYLDPLTGTARVRAPRSGTISVLHVAEGQIARADDPLVTLQSGQTLQTGASAEEAIATQLQQQRAELEAQVAREDDWRRNETRRLQGAIDQFAADIRLLDEIVETHTGLLGLAEDRSDRVTKLAERGVVTQDELKKRDADALAAKLALQSAERERSQKRAELASARIQLDQLPTVAGERLRALHDALANLLQREIEIEARRATVVRAPRPGRVTSIHVVEGGTVEGGAVIATIVPEDTELRAVLWAPARAIARIKPGERATLRYEAFPYQRYGDFKGKVVSVSNSATLPADVERLSPVRVTEPSYMVEVRLERQRVDIDGTQSVALRPDMLLTGLIETGSSPLMAWLRETLFGVSQR